jgi:hypothetical protein
MSVSEVKKLFLTATNAKVVVGAGDDEYLKAKLREAHELAQDLTDKIWRYIPSYRLAHLLFRGAQKENEFFEIVRLLEYAEKSESNYISLNASLLKFAALNRLHLLGVTSLTGRQLACVETIVKKISAVNDQERRFDAWGKPVQSDYFNILEYLVYATAFDYKPLIGAGHDDRNTLFPGFNNDVWTIIGPNGPIDEFSYNYGTGFDELQRLIGTNSLDGYYVLGEPYETRTVNSNDKTKTTFREIKLLHNVIDAQHLGVAAGKLAEIWEGINNPPEAAKKGRKSIEEFLGGNLFNFNSTTNRWSIVEGLQVYGLVKRQHLSSV